MVTNLPSVPSLSAEQQQVHDALVAFATETDKGHLMKVLIGYAGTGKTFTLSRFIKTLLGLGSAGEVFDNTSYSIAMTAPTHKAVRVLKKFSEYDNGVAFATIHSLLGLKEDIDDRTGKIRYVQSSDLERGPRIDEYDVIIVDEASMLSDELFHLLYPYAKKGKKIIFTGDPVQIPPVGHPDSIPFKEDMQQRYGIGMLRLNTVYRQAKDNPILEYATRIRQVYKTAPFVDSKTLIIEGKGIECLHSSQEKEIREIIHSHFNTGAFADDADYMKIIAWRNATVDAFNGIAREEIYGSRHLPMLMKGEKLIMDKPITLSTGRVLLTTNQEVEVADFVQEEKTFDYFSAKLDSGEIVGNMEYESFKYYNTVVNYFDTENRPRQTNIHILHESEGDRVDKIANGIARLAKQLAPGNSLRGKLWRSFYAVQRMFAQVKYNYAVTGHKSQGSTYENCMVIEWDIQANQKIEERNRIKYVAATRARNKLFIVK